MLIIQSSPITPRGDRLPSIITPRFCLPPCPGTLKCTFCGYFISVESCTMWCMTALTEHHVLKVHPGGSKCQGFTRLFGRRTSQCVNESHFVSPFASRWALAFPLSAAVNNTPLSICVPVLAQTCTFFSPARKSRGWNC